MTALSCHMEDVSQLVCHQRGVGVDSHPLGRPGVHFAMAPTAGPYRGPVTTCQSKLQSFLDEPMVLQAFRRQQVGKLLAKVDDEGLRHGIPPAHRRNRLGGLAGRDWCPSRLKGQAIWSPPQGGGPHRPAIDEGGRHGGQKWSLEAWTLEGGGGRPCRTSLPVDSACARKRSWSNGGGHGRRPHTEARQQWPPL